MIGVVGPADAASSIADAIATDDVRVGTAAAVVRESTMLVVAVGDDALQSLVRAGVDAPVLAVDADPGIGSIETDRTAEVIDRAVASGYETRSAPVLGVAIDGETAGRGLYDVLFVTSEPARISEFAVETAGGSDQYRADGVVIATPAGSHGYARTVGGPVLDAESASLAVVPVADFAIRPSVRVANSTQPLTVRVERDEGAISLLVDGEERGEVPTRRPVTVGVDGAVETVVPPAP